MSMTSLSITLLLLIVCAQSSAANLFIGGSQTNFKGVYHHLLYQIRHASRRFPPPCCVTLSTANISEAVTGNTYRKPLAKPPCVEAIILDTNHGPVCVNPSSEWVKQLTANMTKQ